MNLPKDYRERVYAGWIGKCAGVRFGAPIEGWTYREICDNLGELDSYLPLPSGKIFKPDDDTAFPMLLIRAIEDFGPEIGPEEIRETWLNYLADQRGTLWWGGYGSAGEHTAYVNMKEGMLPPVSGSIAMNGRAMAEGIGGQIFSDIWGLVAPGAPSLAADYAERFSAASHDGAGLHGARYLASLVSQAFSCGDMRTLVAGGLHELPAESEYAEMVRSMLAHHETNPSDWRRAYAYILANYGYERYAGGIPIIPNAAIIVMALLWGEGDFHRALCIANMGGWDTDCNAGNVGAIMGVAVGLVGIPKAWRDPLQDEVVLAGVLGARNHLDLPTCADVIADQGERIAGLSVTPRTARCHFRYPGSTHGFRPGGDQGKIVDLRHSGHGDPFGLAIAVKKLGKKNMVAWHLKTSLTEKDLSANYYGASFSPRVWPGQVVETSLWLPHDAPDDLVAGIYCRDANVGKVFDGWDMTGCEGILRQTGERLVPGRPVSLRFKIPRISNGRLDEVGVQLRKTDREMWNGRVVMEYFTWSGEPDYFCDFSRERKDAGAITQWTFHSGYWRLDGGHFVGTAADQGEAYTGDPAWCDYRYSAVLSPRSGERHLILFRVQGAYRSYGFGFDGHGRLVLVKKKGDFRTLAEVPLEWRPDDSYELSVVTTGPLIRAFVNGREMLAFTDGTTPYRSGQVGLAIGRGCLLSCSAIDVQGR